MTLCLGLNITNIHFVHADLERGMEFMSIILPSIHLTRRKSHSFDLRLLYVILSYHSRYEKSSTREGGHIIIISLMGRVVLDFFQQ